MGRRKRIRYKIDPEFKNLITPMQEQEFQQLEKSIYTEGCLVPIVIWNDTIVDGHNRYEICLKHHIPFNTISMHFTCREEAIAWICANQLGRRNISNETRKFLIGVQYNAEKKMQCAEFSNPDDDDQEISILPTSRHRTAERIALKNHITHGTVEKYAIFSKAVTEIGQKCPEMEKRILAGGYKISHDNVLLLAKKSQEDLVRLNARLGRAETFYVPYSETRTKIYDSPPSEPPPQKSVSIKDMPKYDPDAELTGLTLTIPSWVSSMQRVKDTTDFTTSTPEAKEKLSHRLEELRDMTMEVLSMCRSD